MTERSEKAEKQKKAGWSGAKELEEVWKDIIHHFLLQRHSERSKGAKWGRADGSWKEEEYFDSMRWRVGSCRLWIGDDSPSQDLPSRLELNKYSQKLEQNETDSPKFMQEYHQRRQLLMEGSVRGVCWVLTLGEEMEMLHQTHPIDIWLTSPGTSLASDLY